MSNGNTKDFFKKEKDRLIKEKEAPEWLTWMGYQTMANGYLLEGETPKGMYRRVAKAAASYLPEDKSVWEERFFEIMYKGWLAPSTPVASNLGTSKGLSVSCSGNYIQDDLSEIYLSVHESAILTKHGFGTSSYVGDLRPRNAKISPGGFSSGMVSWIEEHRDMTQVVTQGLTRRGAWAGYFPIDHDDFYSAMEYSLTSDRLNLGVVVTDEFIQRLDSGDEEALNRYTKLLETRMVTGRPYVFFVDRVNRLSPLSYKLNNLKVHASNLCTEITLFSDIENTFSCVLSSLNASRFDEWKDTKTVQYAIVFLDCVAQDLIEKGKNIKGLEKVVNFTKRSRALGLGLLGFHSYLQSKMIPFDSLEAQFENDIIFKTMNERAIEASKFLAKWLGQPELCVGTELRNTHLLAVAPNTSSALICESTSQSIEPWNSNVSVQKTSKGKFQRINPEFIKLLKRKKKNNKEVIDSVAMNKGSCQHLDFLSDEEKEVFKTAFEINQKAIIRLAERRQRFIDQAQSINLFFSADEDPQWIHEVHKLAFKSDWIKSLYYVRTQAGIQADKGEECVSCHG